MTVLIWLVHPLQTQSVTYIVQRMNRMVAMFYILALFFARALEINSFLDNNFTLWDPAQGEIIDT